MNNLKPLEKELQTLQKAQQKELQQHQNKRNSLSREVQRLKALIPTLESKQLSLRDNITNKTDLLERINAKIVNADKTVKVVEETLQRKTHELEDTTASLGVIREEYTKLQQKVDSKLEDYKKKRQIAIDEELNDQINEVQRVKSELDELNSEIKSKQTAIAELSINLEDIRQTNKQIVSKETLEITELRQKLAEIRSDISEAEIELSKLYKEKATVSAITKKAEDRHKQFIQYEANARKELEARNTALLKRQEEVGQEERFIKARRAILPEM